MHTVLNVISAVLFVSLGGLNVWIMLTGRPSAKPFGRTWAHIHHAVGYVFIGVFAITVYFMLLRLSGETDELPPRILIHMSLALILAPLLFVKVLTARHRGPQGLLLALGISIFAISFTLIAINIVPLLLRNLSDGPIATAPTAAFILAVGGVLGTLLMRRPGVATPRPGSGSRLSTPAVPSENRRAMTLTLSRVKMQTHDSKTLRFVMPRNERFQARPGQFLTFQWTIEGKAVYRSYSICSSPTQTGYIEIVPKRVPGGVVSSYLNDQAAPGLTVRARGPYGQFCFDESKHQRIVLIAGGSGITPMMSMLHYIDDLCIPVEAVLIYCVRGQADGFFREELAHLQRSLKSFRYVLVLSQADPEWAGPRGHLTRQIIAGEIVDPASSTFFLCGPPAFMEHTRGLLESLHVNRSAILEESFGSSPRISQVPPVDSVAEITFIKSGLTCSVSSTLTVLETAEANGLTLPYGCRQGRCGTCATKLVAGEVRMELEEGLSPDLKAQGYILPCVSHALGDLKLDA